MQYLGATLCALAILLCQFFYGGIWRPAFLLPTMSVLAVIGLAMGIRQALRKPRSISIACFISATLFLAWLCVICSIRESESGRDLLMVFLGCYVLYLVMAFGVTAPLPRLLFLGILLVDALVQAVLGVGQTRGVWYSMPQGWFSEQLYEWYEWTFTSMQVRAHGFFINANHLAWFLNAMALVALALGCLGRLPVWVKVVSIYLGIMLLGLVFFCMSRGGWLALACGFTGFGGLAILAVAAGSSSRRMSLFVVVGIVLIFSIGGALAIFDQNFAVRYRLETIFDDDYRTRLWSVILREMQLEPLMGSGPEAFTYWSRQFKDVPSDTDDFFSHNDWAQITGDYGLLAFSLFVLALLIHFQSGLTSYLEALRSRAMSHHVPQSNSAAVTGAALAAWVAFVVHSFFDFNFQVPANALLAAAFAGFLVMKPKSSARLWPLSPLVAVAMIGSSIWLFIMVWQAQDRVIALKAENAMHLEDAAVARQLIAAGLSLRPSSPVLHRLSGELFLREAYRASKRQEQVSEYQNAATELRRAIELNPRDSRNYALLAHAMIGLQNPAAATDAALEAIRLEPRRAAGYELFALAAELQRDYPVALRAYETSFLLAGQKFGRTRYQQLTEMLRNRQNPDAKK